MSIRGRRHWEYNFGGILDPAAVQDCRKFPTLRRNAFLQLVRDIINGVCCRRYGKRPGQQKSRPNVNICLAEENLEENNN